MSQPQLNVGKIDDVGQYGSLEERGRSSTPGNGEGRSRSLSTGRSSKDRTDSDVEAGGFDVWSDADIEANRISNNYIFGFKKWKSHVTQRPLSNRSETVRSLYSDLTEVKPITVSTLRPFNFIYVLLFGWWQALIYIVVGCIMFLTILGKEYGYFCFRMAGYFFWPFGKFVYVIHSPDYTYTVTNEYVSSSSSGSSNKSEEAKLLIGQEGRMTPKAVCRGFWVNMKAIEKIIFLPPTHVRVGDSLTMDLDTKKLRSEIIVYTHTAINVYYYKYTVDGMNIILVNLLLFVVLAIGLGYSDPENEHFSGGLKCVLATLAIIPLTYYVGMGIISISAQSNFALGAVINATMGSMVEIIIMIVALNKGNETGNACYQEIVKSNLTVGLRYRRRKVGEVKNIDEVENYKESADCGICMVIGGIKYRSQIFNPKSTNVSALLLFVAIGGVFAPTIFAKIYGDMQCMKCENVVVKPNGSQVIAVTNGSYALHCQNCYSDLDGLEGDKTLYNSHVRPLIYASAILLPLAYVVGMIFSLKTHSSQIHDDFNEQLKNDANTHSGHDHGTPQWSRIKSCVILLCCALCIAFCADLITENIQPFLQSSGVSEYFIGVTMIAMVSELPEVINGIQFALNNNVNLGIEIGTNTAIQVCMIQVPLLILIEVIYPFGLLLVFNDVHLYAVVFSVIVINYTFQDGKSDYFQGTVLLFIYVVLLVMYWFMPVPDSVKC
ncbi:hypothetical protein FSP39_010332 [Pinctada imbricata]|uniref:Uncharacterized protein n=1 Tax=Pinctada imbricata TaxID=66713 RepID=A0AA88Y7Y1_PINIB|nr:hypothetical protein FSP39_010332 [Pinctada imbricata]